MEIFSASKALCAGYSRSQVNSPHKFQWHGALMFSSICTWTNGWVNNRDADDLRRHRAYYDATVMPFIFSILGYTGDLPNAFVTARETDFKGVILATYSMIYAYGGWWVYLLISSYLFWVFNCFFVVKSSCSVDMMPIVYKEILLWYNNVMTSIRFPHYWSFVRGNN